MQKLYEKLYAQGVKMFPLQPGSKLPYKGKSWKGLTIRSAEQAMLLNKGELVRGVYERCNFGVDCGISKLIVVDIDVKGGANGFGTWSDLQHINGKAPSTFSVNTPTGGRHLYFRGEAHNSAGKLGPGLDIRGEGGYVLAPGSNVLDEPYTVEKDLPIADAPSWLVALTRRSTEELNRETTPPEKVRDVLSAIEYAEDYLTNTAPPAIEGNGGDATTLQVAMRLKDIGLSQSKTYELMLNRYNPRCEPPWEPDNLFTKIHNAYMYGSIKPGGSLALHDFENLPAIVEPYKAPIDRSPLIGDGSPFLVLPMRQCVELGRSMGKPKHLLDNLIIEGEHTVLFGAPNTAKTVLATQVAQAVASGVPVNGFAMDTVGVPQLVLYCDFELSYQQVGNRFAAMDPHPNLLRFFPNPDSTKGLEGIDSYCRYVFSGIRRAIEANKPALVVLDNLTFLSPELVDPKEAARVITLLKALHTNTGVTMLTVAHTPKRDTSKQLQIFDLAGSANISNMVDAIIGMGMVNGKSEHRYAKHLKVRGGQRLEYSSESVALFKVTDSRGWLELEKLGQRPEEALLKGEISAENVTAVRWELIASSSASFMQTGEVISMKEFSERVDSHFLNNPSFQKLFGKASKSRARKIFLFLKDLNDLRTRAGDGLMLHLRPTNELDTWERGKGRKPTHLVKLEAV